nr:hypothetical protein [Methanobrevibacter arboriphilus]
MSTITLPPSSTNVGDLISSQSNWTGNADNLLNLSTSNYVEFNTNSDRTFRSTVFAKYDIKGAINQFSKINKFSIYNQYTIPTNCSDKLAGQAIAFKHRVSDIGSGVDITKNQTNYKLHTGNVTGITKVGNLDSTSDSNLNPKWNDYYYSYNGWNSLEVCNTSNLLNMTSSQKCTSYKYRLYTMPLIVDYTPPSLIEPETLTHNAINSQNIGNTFEATYNLKAKIYQKAPLNLQLEYSPEFSIENVNITLKNNTTNNNIDFILGEDSYYNAIVGVVHRGEIFLTPIVNSNTETNINLTVTLTVKPTKFIEAWPPGLFVAQNITGSDAFVTFPDVINPVFENVNTNNFKFINEKWLSLSSDDLPQEFPLDFTDNTYEMTTQLTTSIETPKGFIGPIELKTNQGHDTSVTNNTSNTLIKKQYKNRKLFGKTGDYDEQKSLHIILTKKQMVTLQGLVEMDRPFIINTCPNCPDDDPLNHRGYAIVHEIENMKYINGDMAECDIKVQYIENNLTPLVNIQKGSKVNTNIVKPDISETLIMDYYSLVDNFIIENSGNFSYDSSELAWYNRPEDESDTENRNGSNKFELAANEEFKIRKELKDPTDISISFEHLIPNNEANFSNAVRTITIKNKDTDEPVFTYEHINFRHKDYDYESDTPEELTTVNEADVIATTYDNLTGEETSILQDIIQYSYDIDREEDEDYTTTGTYKGYWVGTKININIDDNILRLTDDGFTGTEINIDDLELEDVDYILEFETSYPLESLVYDNLLTRCGIEITENVSTVQKKSMYSNMIVSPSPLSGRNLYFTRETEEGILYYYSHDGYNGTYITTPFTEYKNAVNLQNGNEADILSLANNPSVIVINNGLVKARFDRYYNTIHISKYREFKEYIPPTSTVSGHYKITKGWQDICNLRINDIRKISITKFTPDKIILNVGGTTWTLWRGRPFIEVIHTKKNIKIIDSFDTLWNNTIISELNPNIETNIDYGNYPYIKLSDSDYGINPETQTDYRKGIGIIRPNYADITNKTIPMNSKTVFMPYFEKCYEHDTCENMILEYINLYEQTISQVR